MPQSETKRDTSPKQCTAISRLLLGDTISAASKAAGVSRSTLHRWIKDDFHFQAALNHERRLILLRSTSRVWGLADLAIGIIEDALAEGDRRIAVAVLRGSGLLGGRLPEIGSTDQEVLQLEFDAKIDDAKARAVGRSFMDALSFGSDRAGTQV